ncbi:MAG TPA: hypothetical protein VFV28_03915, partial [Limnobacter sp.]|nr:hypothetical protein [Limnobacter sp.]
MSKTSKLLFALFLLVMIFVVVPHGVVVPRFLWEGRLQALQSQYPNEDIQAKRVVVALSLKPQLMVSEISIHNPARREKVELGLLKVGMDLVESVRKGQLQVTAISLKGLNVQADTQQDCSSFNTRCFPVLPATLAARGFQGTQFANPGFFTPRLALHQLEIEQANFLVRNPDMQQEFSGKIEELKVQLGGTEADQQFSLGWRIGITSASADRPAIANQMYIAVNAKPRFNQGNELQLNHLKVNVDGNWGGFPWTGTAEQDELRLKLEQANNGEGAPFLKLAGHNLRTYIRRDDLPETHQAAFSAQYLSG